MNSKEDPQSLSLPVLRVKQPIGDFFIGVLSSRVLCQITDFDVRRISHEREFETYLGIQRPLNPARVTEISQYVRTLDACFPTSVILSVSGSCAVFDDKTNVLMLSNFHDPERPERTVLFRQIAKVLDGQHRIEGLKQFDGPNFDINVCIFVDVDVAQEAYIFATVNIAQTKVNKSLVYDLFDLAKSHSPQKLCHNVAVALDQNKKSPFYKRIKRLGVATEGRFNETLTQATFVEALMRYLSKDPVADRDLYMRGRTPAKAGQLESQSLIFRNMMIETRDMEIVDVLWNYFEAVRQRWPEAWGALGRGAVLNRTNGFRGLMKLLRDVYLYITGPGGVPSVEKVRAVLDRIEMTDAEFNTDNFKPGTSGEVALYNILKMKSRL